MNVIHVKFDWKLLWFGATHATAADHTIMFGESHLHLSDNVALPWKLSLRKKMLSIGFK
jgi:hypothetical protein